MLVVVCGYIPRMVFVFFCDCVRLCCLSLFVSVFVVSCVVMIVLVVDCFSPGLYSFVLWFCLCCACVRLCVCLIPPMRLLFLFCCVCLC